MRAIDKRVLQAVRLCLPVTQAFGANGNIGRNLRHFVRFRMAGGNTKVCVWIFCFYPFRNGYPVDGCHNRMFTTYAFDEKLPLSESKDGPDADSVIPVVHFPAYPHFVGYPIDKRAETYSLH